MSYLRIVLILMVSIVLTACASTAEDEMSNGAQLIDRPKPVFPQSEFNRAREGWVVIAYTANNSGAVVDAGIKNSSGSDAFDRAALTAVQGWRYEPDGERELSVLLNFVYDRRIASLSREFFRKNEKAHELIDSGDLDAAQEMITKIRNHEHLTAFELAYSFITEGRIAGARGDGAGQLRLFRNAMLNEGRWLARENYLKCLRAAVLLEVEQKDFVSALRDYAFLTETKTGMAISAGLEGPIRAIRAQVDGNRDIASPYMVANNVVSVTRARPRSPTPISARSETREPRGNYPSYPSPEPPNKQ